MWIFWQALITIALISGLFSCTKKKYAKLNQTKTFTFNLPRDVKSFDPLLVRGINQRYVLFNIHRGLYYYAKDSNLKPHGAKSCNSEDSGLTWHCKLNKLNYHNSKPIISKHYINTFNSIKMLKEESIDAISNIKSINEVSNYELTFTLKKANSNFIHQLANINLTPRKEAKVYNINDSSISYSGPYYVSKIEDSYILLKPNKYYDTNKNRLNVKGVFIDDATAALNLFEAKKLDFLRYLETSFYPFYKEKAFLSPHLKLDGLFLNPKIPIKKRKALAHSLRYKHLQKIFSSKGRPGCLQINKLNFSKLNLDCFDFKENLEFKLEKNQPLKISVPSISQKDHVRLAEWLQKEWRSNLGLETEIEQVEAKIFYQKANQGELEIYRRSVPLKELHCKHAKKTLLSLPEFEEQNLRADDNCEVFFKKALKTYLWIPLGLVHLSHLPSDEFTGYYINMLDQFGLEDLKKANINE